VDLENLKQMTRNDMKAIFEMVGSKEKELLSQSIRVNTKANG